MSESTPGIEARKDEHLELCTHHDVEHRTKTLLDDVHLLHDSLPDLAVSDLDLSVEFAGRRLQAPLLITGMTGGTTAALEFNRALAAAAGKFGIAMGVGSQRAMLVRPDATPTFRVRDVAPDIALLANLGAVQARDSGVEGVAQLVEAISADAVCIHLNPAQELVQDEGDRDFRGCLAAIAEIRAELPVPVIVKETGCGMSPVTLRKLAGAGIDWVDVSGSGGTTWTGIEGLRGSPRQRALGAALREWGIPTAASVVYARRTGMRIIASGGIRDGVDAARAIALGADLVGMALPLLQAFRAGGPDGVVRCVATWVESLQAASILVGASGVEQLQDAPRVLGPDLRAWLA